MIALVYLLIFFAVCENNFMIELNKLNGMSIFVNPDLIRVVESTPDTVVNFIDGESIIVLNSPQEIITRIISFRKKYASDFIFHENTSQLDFDLPK